MRPSRPQVRKRIAPRHAHAAFRKRRTPYFRDAVEERSVTAAHLAQTLHACEQQLAQALEQHRVTGEILRVIASSFTDSRPVFDTIVTNAARLCEANFAFVMLHQGDRLSLAARTDCTPEFAEYLEKGLPANRETATGRAALARTPVQIRDFIADPEVIVTAAHRMEEVRTVLAVPMLRDERMLGVIVVWRREVRPFSEQQIRLLETFANEAVIAIENARLLRELESRNEKLTQALEQQTATGEVLRVISSSPTVVQPVFDMIAENAIRLCDGQFSGVFRFDGELIHLLSHRGLTLDGAEVYRLSFPRAPGRDSAIGRAVQTRAMVHIPDVQADSDYRLSAVAQASSMRCVLAVPMLREGHPIGGIVVWRSSLEPFTDSQVKLVATFADQAVIAVENVGLFQELEAKNHRLSEALEQQTATAEILRVISRSPTDVLPVFETIVRNARTLCRGLFANVFRFDGELLHYVASDNTGPAHQKMLRSKYPMRPDASQVSGRVILSRSIVRLEDARADPDYDQRFPSAMGWRRVLGVPILREGKPLGVIAVAWAESGPVSKVQEELLRTFADQAVIAIENVRLFDEIQDKSRQLELASTYKSRFLAAASHDLRQPLHALNLFVGQLQTESDPGERTRLLARIDSAVNGMNELFNALLDISKLDAGVLELKLTQFPVEQLLERVETTFAEAAREKGLRLRVVRSRAWVRSDFILLERIVLNLVSNAVRYTTSGGVAIGARRRGGCLRLDIWDSGIGIPEDQQENIFDEFYQLETPHRRGGLGLGLAIVDRLCRLLGHPVELASVPGRGSRFSVSVPLVAERRGPAEVPIAPIALADPLTGKVIVVIDDDPLVLDGMAGILRSWGCLVLTGDSEAAALARLAEAGQPPDLIISDYRLADGKSGIEAIARVRGAVSVVVPAFLISGDTAPERLRDARASGYHLLHKPVPPMALRTMVNRLVKRPSSKLA